jgi:cytochrome c oxidase subunit III
MTTIETSNRIEIFNPRKFIVWLLIVSSMMSFAGLTSAFIVMKGQGNKAFQPFLLPNIYIFSTVVVFISSLVLHYAYQEAKKNNIPKSKTFVFLTFILGLTFMVMQIMGFSELMNNNIRPLGTQAPWNSSLTFVIISLHMFHLFIAMIVLILLVIKSFSVQVFEKNIITFHNCVVFWHFLGILWVFLYLFLYFSLYK